MEILLRLLCTYLRTACKSVKVCGGLLLLTGTAHLMRGLSLVYHSILVYASYWVCGSFLVQIGKI